jgi:cytochrome c-type biogenesis protein
MERGVIMYDIFNFLSSLLNEPLTTLYYNNQGIPLLSAFLLGILGAVAPCQLTGNISAMMYYGNRSLRDSKIWPEISAYIVGKIFVYIILGILIWIFGRTLESSLTSIFPIVRKLIGPLLITIGLYLMGIIKMRWNININFQSLFSKRGITNSFFLGVILTLGFCPTMFLLFFGLLMPLVLSTSYGIILPGIFGIGTAIPFLLLIFLIVYFDLYGVLLKKSKKLGSIIQVTFGCLLVVLGVLDTLVYWFQ